MFTLKKYALLGAAGLAALAMSCSDSTDDDAVSVSITKPVVSGTSSYSLTGGAVVTANVTIDSVGINLVNEAGANVALAIDGMLPVRFKIDTATTIDIKPLAATYQFSALGLKSCPKNTTVDAYLEIKAWAGAVTETTKSDKISFVCPKDDIVIPNLGGAFNDTTDVTLGGTGNAGSALDLDAATLVAITRTQLNNDATLKNKVDIVYNGTNLYAANETPNNVNGGTLAGTTSEAMLVPVTAAEIKSIDESDTPVADALIIATDKVIAGAESPYAVTVGATFLVITSENAVAIIEVKSKNAAVDAVFIAIRALSK